MAPFMVIPQVLMIQQVMTAGGAFAATNVDDIVILSLFFAQLRHWRQALPLLLGKTLGFSLLVLISLLGLLGQQLLAPPWPGLLGLVPIALGLWRWRLLQARSAEREAVAEPDPVAGPAVGAPPLEAPSRPWAGLLTMAGLTLANGADNIGVYLPLFAQLGRRELAVTLLTFAVGLALLGLLAWGCSRAPGLASLLGRLGEALVPLLLIGLGGIILLDGLALEPAALLHPAALSGPASSGLGFEGLALPLPDGRGPA